MKFRFQSDAEPESDPAPAMIGSDLDEPIAASVQGEADASIEADASRGSVESQSISEPSVGEVAQAEEAHAASQPAADPDAWRREVAAKVSHYRGRRPRAPRYPSLQLKFEAPEPLAPMETFSAPPSEGQLAVSFAPEAWPTEPPAELSAPEGGAKIIEFPRSSFVPPVVLDELAEPVFDRPRIMEVPEVQPPPPVLGGITIEPVERPGDERRPGFELPLISAPFSRRILASAIDGLLVLSALSGFSYVFFRLVTPLPPLKILAGTAGGLLAVFWAAYQYSFLVYTGTTPGLKLAGLQLSRFDGSAVPRRLRRWRVLASILSGLSLALGYAWCFLDEDKLCWHDRITHTYMAPKTAPPLTGADH